MRIGTGDEPHDDNDQVTLHDDNDQVTLPQDIMAESMEVMLHFVYPSTQPEHANLMQNPGYMSERCCLTPLNEESHNINDRILQQLQTPVHTYLSTDRVVTDDPEEAAAYAMEFLNAQTPGGLPKHKLHVISLNYTYLFITNTLSNTIS